MIEALNDLNLDDLLILQKEISNRINQAEYADLNRVFKGLSIMEEKTYHDFYDEFQGVAVKYDGREAYFVLKGDASDVHRFIRKYLNASSYARNEGLSN